MIGLPRAARGVLLIAAAATAIGLAAAHTLLPARAPALAAARPPASTPRPLFGVDELSLMVLLRTRGADVRRVDRAPWAVDFARSSADVITTDTDQFMVFAPFAPGQPRSVCRAELEGAIIGGGDAPAYEIGVGGERETVQFDAPDATFWNFGELIVMTPDEHAYERIAGDVTPVTCPRGQ